MTATIKLLTDYIDRALNFERLAAGEADDMLRGQFLDQAKAYRKLAARKADELGLPPPSEPAVSRSGLGNDSDHRRSPRRAVGRQR